MMQGSGFRWWQAVGIFVVANLVSALPVGFGGDFAFYNSFRQPVVAPPDWLFPPMWMFLNITSLVALCRVANAGAVPGRRTFLISEGVGWVLFAAFPFAFFLLRIPVLGACDTACGLVVACVSVLAAAKVDRLAAVLVAFRLAWLTLATYVGIWLAYYNPDPLFRQAFGP